MWHFSNEDSKWLWLGPRQFAGREFEKVEFLWLKWLSSNPASTVLTGGVTLSKLFVSHQNGCTLYRQGFLHLRVTARVLLVSGSRQTQNKHHLLNERVREFLSIFSLLICKRRAMIVEYPSYRIVLRMKSDNMGKVLSPKKVFTTFCFMITAATITTTTLLLLLLFLLTVDWGHFSRGSSTHSLC